MFARMNIAQVAPLAESVPPKLYGGTERIVAYLTEELVRQGHSVTLFASGDSQTAAELHPIVDTALRFDLSVKDANVFNMLQLEEVRARADEFDMIHFHMDYLHLPMLRELSLGNTRDDAARPSRFAWLSHVVCVSSECATGLHLEPPAPAAARCQLGGDGAPRAADEMCVASIRRRAATISRFSGASRRKSAPTAPSKSRGARA